MLFNISARLLENAEKGLHQMSLHRIRVHGQRVPSGNGTVQLQARRYWTKLRPVPAELFWHRGHWMYW